MKSVPFFPLGIPVLSVSKYLALQGCPCSQLPATLAWRHRPKVPQWNPLSISWRQVQISCKPVSEKYWSHPTSLRKTFQDDFPNFECRFLGPTAALDPLSHWVATPLAGSSTRTFDAEDLIPPAGLRSWYHEELIQHQQLGSTKHRSNSKWWKESFTQTNFIPFLNLLSDSKSGDDADPQQIRHVEFPSRSWGVSKEVPPTHLVDKMVHLDCWMTVAPSNQQHKHSFIENYSIYIVLKAIFLPMNLLHLLHSFERPTHSLINILNRQAAEGTGEFHPCVNLGMLRAEGITFPSSLADPLLQFIWTMQESVPELLAFFLILESPSKNYNLRRQDIDPQSKKSRKGLSSVWTFLGFISKRHDAWAPNHRSPGQPG